METARWSSIAGQLKETQCVTCCQERGRVRAVVQCVGDELI